MGAVFAAVHDQIGRHAAIKVLHPQSARDGQVAQRFLNEARVVNLVEHPGIVEIYDLGRLADGTTYIVMEFTACGDMSLGSEGSTTEPQQAAEQLLNDLPREVDRLVALHRQKGK